MTVDELTCYLKKSLKGLNINYREIKKYPCGNSVMKPQGVQHSTMVCVLSSRFSCPGFDSHHSQNLFREKIVNVAKVNQLCCLQESVQWIKNVHLTHLVLASGHLVLASGNLALKTVMKPAVFNETNSSQEKGPKATHIS